MEGQIDTKKQVTEGDKCSFATVQLMQFSFDYDGSSSRK